jgi:hypothetical protein
MRLCCVHVRTRTDGPHAVARALHLDHEERHHLYDLTRQLTVAEEAYGEAADDEIDQVLLRLRHAFGKACCTPSAFGRFSEARVIRVCS